MNSKTKVLKIARRLGIKLEYGGEGLHFEITAEAPYGFHFKDDEVHELVSAAQDAAEPESSVWSDMAGRIDQGFERCNEKCEWHEEARS